MEMAATPNRSVLKMVMRMEKSCPSEQRSQAAYQRVKSQDALLRADKQEFLNILFFFFLDYMVILMKTFLQNMTLS